MSQIIPKHNLISTQANMNMNNGNPTYRREVPYDYSEKEHGQVTVDEKLQFISVPFATTHTSNKYAYLKFLLGHLPNMVHGWLGYVVHRTNYSSSDRTQCPWIAFATSNEIEFLESKAYIESIITKAADLNKVAFIVPISVACHRLSISNFRDVKLIDEGLHNESVSYTELGELLGRCVTIMKTDIIRNSSALNSDMRKYGKDPELEKSYEISADFLFTDSKIYDSGAHPNVFSIYEPLKREYKVGALENGRNIFEQVMHVSASYGKNGVGSVKLLAPIAWRGAYVDRHPVALYKQLSGDRLVETAQDSYNEFSTDEAKALSGRVGDVPPEAIPTRDQMAIFGGPGFIPGDNVSDE